MFQNNPSRGSPVQLTLALVLVAAVIFFGFKPAGAQAPGNDDFYHAAVIEQLPFSDSVDTIDATSSDKDPWPCWWHRPLNTVWYSYTPSSSALVIISPEGTDYTTTIGVYTGDYETGLSQITCSDNNNPITIEMLPGTTYYIMVGAVTNDPYPAPGTTGGTLKLSVTAVLPPVNDDFDNAVNITSLPFNDVVNTSAATWAADDPADCSTNGSIWYVLTPQHDMLVEVNTAGSWYYTDLAIYTGTRGNLTLVPGGCANYWWSSNTNLTFQASANTTYYIQVGRCCGYGGDGGGYLVFNVVERMPPVNDKFENAIQINQLPFSYSDTNQYANTQDQEPLSNCDTWGNPLTRSVWFAYTSNKNGTLLLNSSGFWSLQRAVYTGTSLGQLTRVACLNTYYYGSPLAVPVQAGKTYYIQIGTTYDWNYGWYQLDVDWAPPPNVSFWYSPDDPSALDWVQFCDGSYDPAAVGFSSYTWNFGDGATDTSSCSYHKYAKDGDYSVTHSATTYDGRSATVTQKVAVRTRDVAITKFLTPQAVPEGKTGTVTVGIQNRRYPVSVDVFLIKISPYGYEYIGALSQDVPTSKGLRTTDFKFNYTVNSEDAAYGKVVFKAYAYISSYRDVFAEDNEAIGAPTRVIPLKKPVSPYYSAVVAPPSAPRSVAAFGLLTMGLGCGIFLVSWRPAQWTRRKAG